ncbi:MAG: hypothetical protein ACREH6_04730, partial [Geminicoccaceae bacterium]
MLFSFTLAILFLTLPGCQSVDVPENTSGSASAPQSAHPSKAPADESYPDLHSVPPRPQLSYTIQQEREIVDALIADREHARYTNRVIRYRTGESSLPPPPEPQKRAEAPAETPKSSIPTVAEPPAAPAEVAPLPSLGAGDDENNTLGDFLSEMERNTRPRSRPAPNEVPTPAPQQAPSAAAPANPAISGGVAEARRPSTATEQDVGSEDGPVKRTLAWVSGLFGGTEPEPVPAASAAQVSAPRALFALRTP